MVERDKPWPGADELDIGDLWKWYQGDAPAWMRDSGLPLETLAQLDYLDIPPPETWERVHIEWTGFESDPWGVTITVGGYDYAFVFEGDWLAAWDLYRYADDYEWVDGEVMVEDTQQEEDAQ